MRIGTWNVEYATRRRNPERLEILNNRNADIWVLTETHRDLDLSRTHIPIDSLPRPIQASNSVRVGSTWVTIWSRYPCRRSIQVPDPRRMAAALLDTPHGPIAVAGVVLPWHADRGDDPTESTPRNWEEHRRVIRTELPLLLETLRIESSGSRRILAGDFNSQLAFPYPFSSPYPPQESLRKELLDHLTANGLTCHTADTEAALTKPPKLPGTLIDHVCSDLGLAKQIETWSGTVEGNLKLSDHPGVVVTWDKGARGRS
jgi:endonuclease/exonuclease/phosphatase family metal-dependent hydrolase